MSQVGEHVPAVAIPAIDGLRVVLANLQRMSGGDRVAQHLLWLDINETQRFAHRNPNALAEAERA